MNYFSLMYNGARNTVKDSVAASYDLFKVMIPIIIVVKILVELDVIKYLALPLKPFMALCGLPGEMGLVWATSMVVNIYTGMVTYFSLMPGMENPLSVAQITVLSTMMLLAHSLPVECKVAQKCGVKMRNQIIFRIAGAMMLGIILHLIYKSTGTLQQPSTMLWTPTPVEPGLIAWAKNEVLNLVNIFWIILTLMAAIRLLDFLRVTEFLNSLLKPFLRIMGISKNAATITVLGLTMGITYGSGLIIHEAKSGAISQRDIFASLTLMGLAHAVIEDTLLMMLLGAHMSGILWGRLIFSLIFVAVMMRVFDRMRRNRVPETPAEA